MSSSTQPISSTRFANALQELPLSSLHSTAAEIRNSQMHLESSNRELQPHADEGDQVCKEAIEENIEVLGRMKRRLDLLKTEVERRGTPWVEEEPNEHGSPNTNGYSSPHAPEGNDPADASTDATGANNRRLLSDEELRRRVEEQIEEQDHDEEDGMHL